MASDNLIQPGIGKSHSSSFFFVLCTLLILIAGFRVIGIDRDSTSYLGVLKHFFSSDQVNFISYEPTFWAIAWIVKNVFFQSEWAFFLIYAVIGVSINMLAIKRTCDSFGIGVVAYLCLYFVLHEMTQIRIGVASGIFLLAVVDLAKQDRRRFLLKSLMAVSFHYAALVMFPLVFLNHKKRSIYIFLLLPVIGIVLGSAITMPLLQFFSASVPRISLYLKLASNGVFTEAKFLSVYGISLWLLLIFFVTQYWRYKDPIVHISVQLLSLGITAFYLLFPLPVFAFRVSEFLQMPIIVLLSMLGRYLVPRPLTYLMVTAYCLIFLYNGLVIQKLLHF